MRRSKMKKGKLLLWLGGVGLYVLALFLLTWAEQADPNASIQSLADAFWYSVVTMSTVGYGDLYPVTAAGKVLGVVFVLLSVGMLTFVIGLMIRLVMGKMLPALKLRRLRSREWFLFSGSGPAAAALQADLQKQYPDGVFLYPEGEEIPEDGMLCPGSMETVAAQKKDRCSLFYVRGEYARAVDALELGHPVYCLTEYAPDAVPQGLTLVDPCECCAGAYWQDRGLEEGEKNIVLIGDGRHAQALLAKGLLLNVFSPWQRIRYYVSGDWEDFQREHYRLQNVIAVNGKESGRDSLYFGRSWNEDPLLLQKADRIILCHEDAEQNLRLLGQLRKYFPTKAKLHLRYPTELPGETVFGTCETIFTARIVMRQQQTKAARAMHEIYRRSTGGSAPAWEELSEFLRQSNIAAADHLITKLRLLLEEPDLAEVTGDACARAFARYEQTPEKKETYRWIEHERWMRFHCLYNWEYDAVRNNAARRHPMILPYEDLSEAEQAKDDYAWLLLAELAEELKA